MTEKERLDICGDRYRQRRDSGRDGWARDESYERKSVNADAFVARYGIGKGARVLELGCGAGNLTLHLARSGFEAYGIDIVPEAIEWAKSKADEEGEKACFHAGSVASLEPFGNDFFDVVFDGDCLWMVLGEDRARCFASVLRTLRPGGYFFAKAHVVSDKFTERYDVAPGAWIDPETLLSTVKDVPMYQYSKKEGFLSEIRDAGFEICRHWMGDLDEQSDEDPAFYEGVLFVEAQKP
jgi:SAM-dependent methyltransferase